MAKPNVVSKDDLLKYAKDCLAESGLEKFTLRSVADASGVTQGTIYYHFKTKDQLLLDIVQDICESSWSEITQQCNQFIIKQAIESAKNRCSYDSYFHKLFLTLVVASFNNEIIRDQLGALLKSENDALTKNLTGLWGNSPIDGVALDTWGILLNAIVDGLAIQALLQKDFPVDKIYQDVEQLFNGLLNKGKKL